MAMIAIGTMWMRSAVGDRAHVVERRGLACYAACGRADAVLDRRQGGLRMRGHRVQCRRRRSVTGREPCLELDRVPVRADETRRRPVKVVGQRGHLRAAEPGARQGRQQQWITELACSCT